MIKIDKDLSAIPESLKLPFNDNFTNDIPIQSKTTHKRRLEVISSMVYIDQEKYNDRYKQDDTKTSLKTLYHSKCAFCEQRVEQCHVEHYRPKQTYYWLAYSWDNLLLACPNCNQYKGVNFDIKGTIFTFENTDANIHKIHNSSIECDRIECPKMVNPEVTNPDGKIKFEMDGIIKSEDEDFAYTIEKCKIDRADLNDQRRKLLDVFKKDIMSAFLDNKNKIDLYKEIAVHVKKFVRDSKDLESQFLAFRRYAISEGWIDDIIKSMN